MRHLVLVLRDQCDLDAAALDGSDAAQDAVCMAEATEEARHESYLAVYVDAVERVELPNTLGMGQAGDGGLMASKPYLASGKYIERRRGAACARAAATGRASARATAPARSPRCTGIS
jgi:deoxyribodipyrimidine photolyase-like uncharacterized protein